MVECVRSCRGDSQTAAREVTQAGGIGTGSEGRDIAANPAGHSREGAELGLTRRVRTARDTSALKACAMAPCNCWWYGVGKLAGRTPATLPCELRCASPAVASFWHSHGRNRSCKTGESLAGSQTVAGPSEISREFTHLWQEIAQL